MSASFQEQHIKSKNFSPLFAKSVSFISAGNVRCHILSSLSYPSAYLAREIRRLLLAVISFILRTFNIFGHNTGGLYAVNKKS